MSRQTRTIGGSACLVMVTALGVIGCTTHSESKPAASPTKAPRTEEQAFAAEATLLQRSTQPGSPDCALQPDREALLRKLESAGIILKWDHSDDVCHLWVTAKFRELAKDVKLSFAMLVVAWAKCENSQVAEAVLYDAQSEETVGHYGMKYGGLKMK